LRRRSWRGGGLASSRSGIANWVEHHLADLVMFCLGCICERCGVRNRCSWVWLRSLSGAGAGLGARSGARSGFGPAAATDSEAGRAPGKEHLSDEYEIYGEEKIFAAKNAANAGVFGRVESAFRADTASGTGSLTGSVAFAGESTRSATCSGAMAGSRKKKARYPINTCHSSATCVERMSDIHYYLTQAAIHTCLVRRRRSVIAITGP
jgi:hypothetical protein